MFVLYFLGLMCDLPLLVIVDNGSTEEDLPAFKQTAIYGIDVVVVDHHHPDAVVDQYLCVQRWLLSEIDQKRRRLRRTSISSLTGTRPSDLSDIALALDYAAFWLKFQDGRGLVNDILNFGKIEHHKGLVKLLCEQARGAIENQLAVCMPHVRTQRLPNGVSLNVIDLEHFAHKFTFPPPGKTSGEIHDRICQGNDDPVVTLGYGPDSLRSGHAAFL